MQNRIVIGGPIRRDLIPEIQDLLENNPWLDCFQVGSDEFPGSNLAAALEAADKGGHRLVFKFDASTDLMDDLCSFLQTNKIQHESECYDEGEEIGCFSSYRPDMTDFMRDIDGNSGQLIVDGNFVNEAIDLLLKNNPQKALETLKYCSHKHSHPELPPVVLK